MRSSEDTSVPQRIGRLNELAHNLWWSWNPQARELFRALDYQLWRLSGHNPVKLLLEVHPEKLRSAASDPTFLRLYDSVMAAFDEARSSTGTWFSTAHPGLMPGPVAFFSMEFAIHNSLPLYAGGLGILAGDICKEASDMGLPLVGVGFMYPQGYFHQYISQSDWQEESYQQLNFAEAPVERVWGHDGRPLLVQLPLDERSVYIAVWRVRVGRTDVYLLDTDVEQNAPPDRKLSARLYTADREQRIQQEIVLGVGGVRVLRSLGIEPSVWHANEGHTAFMMLERVREQVQKGVPFNEAVERVKANTVFTTHTPVPAGNEVFLDSLVRRYLHSYWRDLGIDQATFFRLGEEEGANGMTFNMTALGMRLSAYRNGVSKLHGRVTRRMWKSLWPGVPEDEVPITHVTNGIHVPTWVAPEADELYRKYLGADWLHRQDDPSLWDKVLEVPDEELWAVRQQLKRKLIGGIRERAARRWSSGQATSDQVVAMGALLDPEVLTIGFARRFTEYKRPTLLFKDVERLKRILNNPWQPVQIVFAGKSHPADLASKHLLKQVYSAAKDRQFQGRICFVEDYDMHVAHYLVQGVDVWLNNPRRPLEASGTSGMKACLNGAIHMSILDGWWYEGYNGANGWAVGDGAERASSEEQDRVDAESIYQLLEEQVVPLFYDRDRNGVPHGWVRKVKEAIRSTVPFFCARRMVKEYTERMYIPAFKNLAVSRQG